jgi:hemolysin activation/secretion protein
VRRALCLTLLLAAGTPAVSAQVVRPGDQPPALPEFESPEPGEPLRLPPIPPVSRPDRLPSGPRVFVRSLQIEGNRALSSSELEGVAGPWLGRALAAEELIELRDALTGAYVARGYVNSGAVLPDQELANGELQVTIVEGVLAAVAVEGTTSLDPDYVRSRLERSARTPLDVHALQERLQLLQQDPRIARIEAELRPGALPGEGRLDVRVEEAQRFSWIFSGANDQPPGIGETAGELRMLTYDLTGAGDILDLAGTFTEGMARWEARYAIPLGPSDTLLELRGRGTYSDVVESPFDELDIESRAYTYGVGLSRPVYRTPRTQLRLGVTGELRRTETKLLGQRFSFAPGAEEGWTRATVLRSFADWTRRSRDSVIAVRSTLSFGVPWFDASDAPHIPGVDTPDGTFVAWLGQVQWARLLPDRYRGSQLIVRGDAQLTPDALLSMEQFGLGGHQTVRGYRENELVRDNALVGSLELRVPVLRSRLGANTLDVGPFFDIGYAWNHDSDTPGPKTLASLGLGARYRPNERLLLETSWGGKLRNVGRRTDDTNLQRYGFYVRSSLRF